MVKQKHHTDKPDNMNKLTYGILTFFLLTGIVQAGLYGGIPEAAHSVNFENTGDSWMRKYQEPSVAGVPSPGYYTHWSVFLTSADNNRHRVDIQFQFDSGMVNKTIYVVPGISMYADAVGHMNTWTNKVNVTVIN